MTDDEREDAALRDWHEEAESYLRESARHEAELAAKDAEIAARDARIHQLGENAATAAREYAEEVERLREALRNLYRSYVGLLESGRDRITDLGGTCDSVERMEEGDPALIAVRAILEQET